MKRKVVIYFILFLTSIPIVAQPSDPYPGDFLPIDGGVVTGVLVALAFGIRKILNKKE